MAGSDGIRAVETDLDAARDPHALVAWPRHVAALYEIEVSGAREATFRVAGITWQLPHGFLNSTEGSGCTLLRSPELVARSPVDVLSVFRLRKGRVAADYDGRLVKLRARAKRGPVRRSSLDA